MHNVYCFGTIFLNINIENYSLIQINQQIEKFEFKNARQLVIYVAYSSDSVRKGLIYTPNLNDHLEEDAAVSFEQKRGINYQHEYMRLYIANVVLTQQLKELLQEKGDLVTKIGRLEETENVKVHHPRSQQTKHQDSEQHSIRNKSSEMQQKHSKSHNEEGNMQNYMKTKYQQDQNACPNHQYQTRKLIRKN